MYMYMTIYEYIYEYIFIYVYIYISHTTSFGKRFLTYLQDAGAAAFAAALQKNCCLEECLVGPMGG